MKIVHLNCKIIFLTACLILGITPKGLQPKFPASSYPPSTRGNIEEFARSTPEQKLATVMAAVSWLVGDWLSLPIALEWRSHKMANFYSMFGFLAVNSFVESEPGNFDMLSRLPIEMALTVLRLLPGKDLLNAVLVSTKWLKLCKSDPKLRQKVRRYLRQMRRVRLATLMGRGSQLRGKSTRNSPVMGNVTNAERNNISRLRENGVQSRSGSRLPLPYQRDMVEKPKKLRNVKIMDFSAKNLRI